MKKPGAEVNACHPSAGEVEKGEPWGLLANQDAEIVSFRFSERSRLKQIKRRAPKEDF